MHQETLVLCFFVVVWIIGTVSGRSSSAVLQLAVPEVTKAEGETAAASGSASGVSWPDGNAFTPPGFVAWGCNTLNRGVHLTFDDGWVVIFGVFPRACNPSTLV